MSIVKRLTKFLQYHHGNEVKVIEDTSECFGVRKLEYDPKTESIYLDNQLIPLKAVDSVYVNQNPKIPSSIFVKSKYNLGEKFND